MTSASPISTDTHVTSRSDVKTLAGFTIAHGMFHFMQQSFAVMLPAIKDSFGLNPIQIGALMTAREIAMGVSSLPGGVISDRLRRYRGIIMAFCIALFGVSWLSIGLAPVYPVLIVGMVFVSVATSVWHLPSMAEISQRFEHRKGASLAIFGIGGSFGDIFGPVATGLLLGIMAWREVISFYAAVPLLMTFWFVWSNRSAGKKQLSNSPPDEPNPDLKTQFRITWKCFKTTAIWKVNLVAGLRGMCYTIYVTFLPLFMQDQLGFSSKSIGFHFGLLWAIGIVASPLMGHLSDRFGRKPVLVPALLCSAALTVILALFGFGFMFTVIIAALGLFLRSDYALLSAAILDIVGKKVATTMLGILSFLRFTLAAIAPLIAGYLYQNSGMKSVFFFVAGLFTVSAIVFASADLGRILSVESNNSPGSPETG
jgi:FSR family fosmidomycin resistance protein-like MFS transporter